jgi:hypothetical protein
MFPGSSTLPNDYHVTIPISNAMQRLTLSDKVPESSKFGLQGSECSEVSNLYVISLRRQPEGKCYS